MHSVFWDLYCAAPDRRETCEHSSEAKAFHDYVSELNQPSRAVQVHTHPPLPRACELAHTHTHTDHTENVHQKEGTILSEIMLLVLVLTCLCFLLSACLASLVAASVFGCDWLWARHLKYCSMFSFFFYNATPMNITSTFYGKFNSVFMATCNISHDLHWWDVFFPIISVPQLVATLPEKYSSESVAEVKGHCTAGLFIGPLVASVKVKSHKAAGWSCKHIYTHIYTQLLAMIVAATEDGLDDERSGSGAPWPSHLL